MTEKNEAKAELKCEECEKARGASEPAPVWGSLTMMAGSFTALASIWLLLRAFGNVEAIRFPASLVTMAAMLFFGLSVFFLIWRMVGRAFFIFIDEEGEPHVHLKPPSKDFQLENQVLKIWLGGWLRRNELDGPGSAAWQVPQAIIPDIKNPDEWRVTVRDIHGHEITLNPRDLLSITSQRVCVDGMLTDHREKMEILDSIGFELVWMHGEILKDKKKLGRSKAVQKLRQDIESILDNEQIRSSGLYAKWLRQVEHTAQVLAEREANIKRGNGSSDQPPVQA